MSDFDELVAILVLDRADEDTFAGSHPSKGLLRTFGGQLMAQAFVAASRTLTRDLPPSALSVHLIAGGDPRHDIDFRVTRLRDERRFASRRVDATQDGKLLASALVSYVAGGRGGLEHRVEAPKVPEPHTLPPLQELVRGYEGIFHEQFLNALRPVEVRYANAPSWVLRSEGERLRHNRVWVRAGGTLPDDPVLHTAAMIWSSDASVLDSIITTHGLSWGFDRIFAASANHSMWFHGQVDFNDWALYATSSPVAAESRGLATGHFFDRGGRVIATVAQEGLVKYFPANS